MEKVQ